MGKKGNIYIILTVITLALLMLLQYNKPKEINWFPSYVAQHKIPYGTYVLNDLMTKLFPKVVEQISVPPFEFLNDNYDAVGTYFMVNQSVAFGDAELEALLDWTSEGNTLFIASGSFEEKLLDTLHLETSGLFGGFGEKQNQLHALVHPNLKPDKTYPFEKDSYINFFQSIDTLNTTVLGVVDSYNEEESIEKKHFNVVQQAFGQGKIILSTFPKAFTNYFILKDTNKDYTSGLLSYIDGSKPIYMDNHYKSGKSFYTSPMHIFLNNKELKWAYYIVLIGALLYLIFEGKRKQRAIPIVVPLKNQTIAFTRTIADMYYEKGQQKAISEHKIEQFLEYVRSHFYMDTFKREQEFYKNLASRSSHSFEETQKLFTYIDRLKTRSNISNEELKKLNSTIEKFKHKADGK